MKCRIVTRKMPFNYFFTYLIKRWTESVKNLVVDKNWKSILRIAFPEKAILFISSICLWILNHVFKVCISYLKATGTLRHTEWVCFRALYLSTFAQSLWKYYCGCCPYSSKGSICIFIYLINDVKVKVQGYFIFFMLLLQSKQSKGILYDLGSKYIQYQCICCQNLNIFS